MFCSTVGASIDLISEGTRRLFVNAVFGLLSMEVPIQGACLILEFFFLLSRVFFFFLFKLTVRIVVGNFDFIQNGATPGRGRSINIVGNF